MPQMARPTSCVVDVEAIGEPCIHVHGIVFLVRRLGLNMDRTHRLLHNALCAVAFSSEGKGAQIMGCSVESSASWCLKVKASCLHLDHCDFMSLWGHL